MPVQGRKRYLFSTLLFVTITGCILLIYFSIVYRGNGCSGGKNCKKRMTRQEAQFRENQCVPPCTTKECVWSSNFIQNNLDERIDPCQDFYAFSCGKWMSRFRKDDNYSLFDSLGTTLKIAMKNVLDTTNAMPGSTSEKMKLVYDSCMDYDSSEVRSVPALLQFLNETGIHNWPNLSSGFEFFSQNLSTILGILASHNEFAFVSFEPSTHSKGNDDDSDKSILHVFVRDQFPLGHDNSSYEKLEDMITEILQYFNMDDDIIRNTWHEFKMVDSAILELYLENLDKASGCDEDSEQGKTELICPNNTNPNLGILCNVVNSMLESTKMRANATKERVFISCHTAHYVENVFITISNFTDKFLANYLALRLFIVHLDNLNIFFRQLGLKHPVSLNANYRTGLETTQWERCVTWISNYMPLALGFEYVPKKITKEALDEITVMKYEFIQEAVNYTNDQEWIADKDKKKIIYSIESVDNYIEHYIGFLLEKSKVDFVYKEFTPTSDSFIRNILEYQKAMFILSMTSFQEDFAMSSPFVVNAFHTSGTIDLRFGLLLPPILLPGRPKLLNFATMGVSIGHEIGHEILHYFWDKNVENGTYDNFLRRKECFEEQYSQFEVKKIKKKVKGNVTFSEDIADFIGLKLTQKVIEKYFEHDDSAEFFLPALKYSTKQLLYVSMAQMWCAVRSKEKEMIHYELDSHTPPMFRVIGMLQNSKEFSEVFHCLPGTPMNPENKCDF